MRFSLTVRFVSVRWFSLTVRFVSVRFYQNRTAPYDFAYRQNRTAPHRTVNRTAPRRTTLVFWQNRTAPHRRIFKIKTPTNRTVRFLTLESAPNRTVRLSQKLLKNKHEKTIEGYGAVRSLPVILERHRTVRISHTKIRTAVRCYTVKSLGNYYVRTCKELFGYTCKHHNGIYISGKSDAWLEGLTKCRIGISSNRKLQRENDQTRGVCGYGYGGQRRYMLPSVPLGGKGWSKKKLVTNGRCFHARVERRVGTT